MAGVGITVGFDDGPIRRHLAALALLHASGYDRARREIGEYMVGQVQDNLRDQKLVDGSPMPPSKAAAGGIVRKRIKTGKNAGKMVSRTVKPRNTLLREGHLRNNYVYQLIPGGVQAGNGLEYAAIHHFGGPAKAWGKHPFTMIARPILGLNADGEREVGDILLAELRRAQRL